MSSWNTEEKEDEENIYYIYWHRNIILKIHSFFLTKIFLTVNINKAIH